MAKLNGAGSALIYSTYLGGSGAEGFYYSFLRGGGITVDASGSAYVTGWTHSADFPTENAVQSAYGGLGDAFVTKLDPAGSVLVYSTYLGGEHIDIGFGIAVDDSGDASVTGLTHSYNFPTANPLQRAFGEAGDAFIAKITTATADLSVIKTDYPDPVTVGSELIYRIFLTNHGPDRATGVTLTDTLPDDVIFLSVTPTNGDCTEEAGTVTCSVGHLAIGTGASVIIAVRPTRVGEIVNVATVMAAEADPDQGNNTATETTTVTKKGK